MTHAVPTDEQIALARAAGAQWVNSLDSDGHLCRALINSNSLTDRLDFPDMDLPIHQTNEIRDRQGRRIL